MNARFVKSGELIPNIYIEAQDNTEALLMSLFAAQTENPDQAIRLKVEGNQWISIGWVSLSGIEKDKRHEVNDLKEEIKKLKEDQKVFASRLLEIMALMRDQNNDLVKMLGNIRLFLEKLLPEEQGSEKPINYS